MIPQAPLIMYLIGVALGYLWGVATADTWKEDEDHDRK